MVGHGGSSAGSYLADPTSPIPSHCASIVATSTLRVKWYGLEMKCMCGCSTTSVFTWSNHLQSPGHWALYVWWYATPEVSDECGVECLYWKSWPLLTQLRAYAEIDSSINSKFKEEYKIPSATRFQCIPSVECCKKLNFTCRVVHQTWTMVQVPSF